MNTGSARSGVSNVVVVVATLLVVICTALLHKQTVSRGTIYDVVFRQKISSRKATLALVATADDCRGNLSVLSLFQRPLLNERLNTVVLLDGSEDELRAIRDDLRREHGAQDLRRISRSEKVALAGLGTKTTPFWVLFDGAGRVRMVGHAPRSPQERLALATMLETSVFYLHSEME